MRKKALKTLRKCRMCKYYDEEDNICFFDNSLPELAAKSLSTGDQVKLFHCDEFEYDRDKDLDNDL